MATHQKQADQSEQKRLFVALTEDLRLPLLQIAREAELAREQSLDNVRATAEYALWLVDSLILAQSVQQQQIQLEPVTASSVLYDTASTLEEIAKQYDCTLELDVSGRFAPVMAHRKLLQSALVGMAGAMISALSDVADRTVRLSVHKTPQGIVAGCYADGTGLSDGLLERGRQLYGSARQPLGEFSAQSGASVFIADVLLAAMQAHLRTGTRLGKQGLAVSLMPSSQLRLV